MKNVFLLLFVVASVKSFGQYYNSTAQTNINFTTAPRGFLTGLQAPKGNVVGNAYFYSDQRLAEIYLKDSTKIENVMVRLDMSSNLIEIQYNNETKVLPVSRVLGVKLKPITGGGPTEEFLNSKVLFKAGLYTERLMKVVYAGPVALICKADVHLKEARRSQNPMLGANDADDEIIVKKSYIIAKDQDPVETDKGKSKVSDELTEKFGEKAVPYLKKTNYKDEQDLVELVKHLNEIVKS
jgi:hypothetical protein